MKKFVILFIVSLSAFNADAQFVRPIATPSWYHFFKVDDLFWLATSDTSEIAPANYPGAMMYQGSDKSMYYSVGTKWEKMGSGNGGSGGAFNGNRPITRDFGSVTGVNLGTSDVSTTLAELLYPSQKPTASLTGTYGGNTASSFSLEKTGSASISVTLNWSAGRSAYTDDISSIVVDGVSQSFTPPAASSSVSGTQSSTVTANANTTLSSTVTTSDSKTATASVGISWRTKWYYGFISSGITNPSDGDISGLSGQALTTSRIQNSGGHDIIVANSTNRRFVIVQDAALDPGSANQIFVGGLNSTGAFTKTTRSYTNSLGYSYSVNIYVLENTTSGSFNFQIQ